ncbi:hypothetical protein FisN_1Hh289 [Fistulifera solaris]|jgi:hypothetical protein|uniref:Uncharacterized protein n=1 Tax=Fistulifera solaris TaxID=1519565 RepID=A0A1Z5JEJ5_FISSO|nr:hypothetical protein FisN_1Hh289 [Fistulifera solaris]|eukprot:GAX12356.1 hypothetical protein FisN_1Hh289 [Fistulifera solaris]
MNRDWGMNQVLNESPPLSAEDYEYEECAPSRRESPIAFCGKGFKPVLDVLVKGDHAPLPADRLARKQRIVGRRGGVGQLQLVENAARAALDTNESDDETGIQRESLPNSSLNGPQPMAVDRTSPRKRARMGSTHAAEPDPSVAAAGKLFEGLSTLDDKDEEDPVRGVVRRTSRRTSYDSKIKDAKDDFLLLSAYATNASQLKR